MSGRERGSIVFFVSNDDESKLIGFGIELGESVVRINVDGTVEPKGQMKPVKTAYWPVEHAAPVFCALGGVVSAFWYASLTGGDGIRVVADVVRSFKAQDGDK